MTRPMPHILGTNRPRRLQPGWYDVAVDRDLDLAGLRVVGDLAVLESRHEQITDGILVAGGDAQRTCRAVIAGDRRHAVRVAFDIPGLPDFAPGDICRRTRLVVFGDDHATLELLEHHATFSCSRVEVAR